MARELLIIHFPAFRFNLFRQFEFWFQPKYREHEKGFPLQSGLKDKPIEFMLTSSFHTLKSNSNLLFLKNKTKR